MSYADSETAEIESSPENIHKQEIPIYRKKAFQVLSGLAIIGGAFGAGALTNSEEAAPADTEETTADSGSVADTDENSISSDEEQGLPEQEDRQGDEVTSATEEPDVADNGDSLDSPESSTYPEKEYNPILMDASTPEELISQLGHNYDCVYNSSVIEQQLDCARYIVGDGATGSLSSSIREVAFSAQEYRTEVDPDWTYSTERTIVDSSLPIGEPIAEEVQDIELVVRLDEEDGTEIHKRLQFVRTLATTVTEYENQVDRETTEEAIWLLRSERQVEPGTRIEIG